MYHLQLENPKRGDWASSVKKNLEDLNINFSNEEIKMMSKYKYKNLVKKKCKEKALERKKERTRCKIQKFENGGIFTTK